MKKPVIIVLSDAPIELARKIAELTGGVVHGLRKRAVQADVLFDDTGAYLRELFAASTPIIGLMSSGALIRLLAPTLSLLSGG